MRRTTRYAGLAALSLGMFAIGTSEFVIMGMLSQVAESLSVTTASAGALVTAYAVGVAVGAPALILVLARKRRPVALMVLLALFVVSHVAAALSPTFGSLVVARFVGGLPHGAFFGIAAVVGASLVSKGRQGTAIAIILGGLTAANIVGVPACTWVAQNFGWRATFVVIGVQGAAALVAVSVTITRVGQLPIPSIKAEVRGLFNRASLATLLTVSIGFAGLFTMYAYIEPLMTEAVGLNASYLPWVLVVIGVGFTAGNFFGGWATDRSLKATLLGSLAVLALALATLPWTTTAVWSALVSVFVVGFATFAAEPPIQKRLIDQAPDAPTLASATNQSAFNLANAIGASVGGLILAQNVPMTVIGPVGAMFVLVGAGLAWWSIVHEPADLR